MNWGMISYEIPLARYPDTYNGRPLGVLALAAQARHYALYLNAVYTSPELEQRLRDGYAAAGHQARSSARAACASAISPASSSTSSATSSPRSRPSEFIAAYEASRAR